MGEADRDLRFSVTHPSEIDRMDAEQVGLYSELVLGAIERVFEAYTDKASIPANVTQAYTAINESSKQYLPHLPFHTYDEIVFQLGYNLRGKVSTIETKAA